MPFMDKLATIIKNWRRSPDISNKSEQVYLNYIILMKSFEDLENDFYNKEKTFINQGEKFLRDINAGKLTDICIDLAQAWDEWESTFQDEETKKTRSFWQKMISPFVTYNETYNSRKSSRQLEEVSTEIGRKIRQDVKRAATNITSVQSGLFGLIHLVDAFSNDTILMITFLYLHHQDKAMAKWAMNAERRLGLWFPSNVCMEAQEVLTRGLKDIGTTVPHLFNEGRFDELNDFLSIMKTNTMLSKKIEILVNDLSTARVDQRFQSFQEGLIQYKNYEDLCNALLSHLEGVKSTFSKLRFLNEKRAGSPNEYDRTVYYTKLAKKYTDTAKIQCLAEHVDVNKFKLKDMEEDALRLLERETESVGNHVLDLLETFPSMKEDFKNISIWYGNLTSVEKCFEDASSIIAGSSRRLKEKADRLIRIKLDDYLNMNGSNGDVHILVSFLLTLKKASTEIFAWRKQINEEINKFLLQLSKTATSPRYLLDISCALQNIEGEDSPTAKQLLSDHQCFEGSMNAVFNAATARQGIEYVINRLDLNEEKQNMLRKMHHIFKEEYETIVKEGLVAMANKDSTIKERFFEYITDTAKNIAGDYDNDYCTQLTDLTAHIFAYWSLKNYNSFNINGKSNPLSDNEYIKKPHDAQVVAIWTLLNYQNEEYMHLRNHLVEILTGEGKSIVLGVTSIILAMMGCEVECVCYSSYLSKRDHEAFKSMFRDFGVSSFINYETIESLCDRVFKEDGNLHNLTKDTMMTENRSQMVTYKNVSEKRLKVLLIDEVDVFFKNDFYGETENYLSALDHESISNLMEFIWSQRNILNENSLLQHSKVKILFRDIFLDDTHDIVLDQVKQMVHDAKRVDTHKYIVAEENIAYKRLDGITFNWWDGYLTSFASRKEYEKGNVTKAKMLNRQRMCVECDHVSNAEVPTNFHVILGVTGTLKALSDNESTILKDQYNIKESTLVPSVYGNNKLCFAGNNSRDLILCDDSYNHFMEIRNEINTRRKAESEGPAKRPVMVFFESSDNLIKFYESDHMSDLKSIARIVTESTTLSEKEGSFLHATTLGAITLMIREFGRGTDFPIFDSRVIDSGGVHVIQTFFCKDVSEEIQIKGRTARQGTKGSYSMVLNTHELQEQLGITSADVEEMRNTSNLYSFLNSKRKKNRKRKFERLNDKVTAASDLHYETMDFKNALLSGNRNKVLKYLHKFNNVESFKSFPHSNFSASEKKKQIEEERNKVKMELQLQEQEKRRAARKEFQEGEEKSVLLLENEEKNYYKVLGVEQEATDSEIQRAFRQMARKYHPDKGKAFGAENLFKSLTEAKENLLCPIKRAEHDAQIDKNKMVN